MRSFFSPAWRPSVSSSESFSWRSMTGMFSGLLVHLLGEILQIALEFVDGLVRARPRRAWASTCSRPAVVGHPQLRRSRTARGDDVLDAQVRRE